MGGLLATGKRKRETPKAQKHNRARETPKKGGRVEKTNEEHIMFVQSLHIWLKVQDTLTLSQDGRADGVHYTAPNLCL